MKKQLIQAEEERRAMIEMYKAGFSDACKKWNAKIQKACFKAYKRRFMNENNKDHSD